MSEQWTIPPKLIEALRNAQHVAVLTGAGISAESGLPTFRDPMTGLWAQYRPEELDTPQAFQRNPRLVWEWFDWRRQIVAEAEPNPAHYALVDIERHVPQFTLLTQNIDSLHQKAGSSHVIELHGNLSRTKCNEDGTIVETWEETDDPPPRCPRCDSLLRPDVVWFGERLTDEAFDTATQATRDCDLFLSIGTSGTVEPAAHLPYRALDGGAVVVLTNLDVPNRDTHPLYMINAPAGQLLPTLVQATWPDSIR
ncbi:MAG: NAD-dependent deacylase [Chloroflexota bacterium]